MENINELFRDHYNEFTIYVVEKRFVVGRGLDFFKSYIGKPNYIDSDKLAHERINKILEWIGKAVPPIASLIEAVFATATDMNVVEIAKAITQLLSSQNHQAAGPEAIDPIIIQEGKILKKHIIRLINIHEKSFIRPAIIIMLKDNDFERAKQLLSECPNGTNIKFIYNNGKTEICKVINTGAKDISGFLDSFAHQCFSTCSNTRRDILCNQEWAGNSIVKKFSPLLLKYRSNLLCDEKMDMIYSLNEIINSLENYTTISIDERNLINNFLCIAKLYRVYCKDYGGSDILDAHRIAQELDNEILLANVYKKSYFFSNKGIEEQKNLLEEGYKIFKRNEMLDNALYCKNNILVRQFDSDIILTNEFDNMLGDAISDVPGLVGMSHIYNNVAVAHMMTANVDRAMELFEHGIDYSKSADRIVQNIAITCNKLVLQSYYHQRVEYNTIYQTMRRVYDGMVYKNQLLFIAARYAMNLLIVAIRQDKKWAKELLQQFALFDLFNKGLQDNIIGSGQLLLQMDYVDQELPEINIKARCQVPHQIVKQTGRRKDFIESSALNPFYFFTWL